MFEMFLERYYRSIYLNSTLSFKDLAWYEKVMVSLFFVAFVPFYCYAFIGNFTVSLFFFIGIILYFVVLYYYFSKKFLKEQKEQFKRYKKSLGNLKDLLNSKDFNSYSESGLSWIISCCESKLKKRNMFAFFEKYIFPMLTLVLGAILSNLSKSNLTESFLLMVLSLLMFFGAYLLAYIVVDTYKLINRKILACEYLLQDSVYLKTQLSELHQ